MADGDQLTPLIKLNFCFSLLLSYIDVGSGIWVGINLFIGCHYDFSKISFILTATPTIILIMLFSMKIIYNYQNNISMIFRILPKCFLLCIFSPIVYFVGTMRFLEKDSVGNFIVKIFKFLEVATRSVPQLIFILYIRTFLGPKQGSDGYIQIASVVISYFATLYDISELIATHYGKFHICKISDLIKCFCIIFIDVSLVLSTIVISTIVYGSYLIIGMILVLIFFGMLIQFCLISKNELNGPILLYSEELFMRMPLFVLANVPTNRRYHKKEYVLINKIFTNLIMGLGLFSLTMLLKIPNISDIKYFHHLNNGTQPGNYHFLY